jgi:predicted Zn-dependent peptidase
MPRPRAPTELERALDSEISKLLSKPLDALEVTKSKAQLSTQFLSALETVFVRANSLNEAEVRSGDPGELERSALSRLESVTSTGLDDIARRVLKEPRLTLTFVPKKDLKGKK